MTAQYGFYFDASRCIKCHACEIACKAWNEVEALPRWRQVVKVTAGAGANLKEMNVSMACMHCAEPPCRDACPVGAITKRAEDGIVVVNEDRCIGCGFCAWACPFGAPQFGANGKMQKCNFCSTPGKARPHGLPRACEEVCPTNTIRSGPLGALAGQDRIDAAERLDGTARAARPSLILQGDG